MVTRASTRVSESESGQTVVEYLLTLAMVMSFFIAVSQIISSWGLPAKLLAPLNGRFAHAYQYGHPEALGYDDGGPQKHPRANAAGNGNFRIFTLSSK